MSNKKSKTPLIVIAICAFILIAAALTVLILTGKIGGKRHDPDKERFEKALSERYGEDFVCFEWGGSGVFEKPIRMSGICAPARDITLRFRADIEIGSETRLSDGFPYALANRQLSEEITEKLSGIWIDFGIKSNVLTYEDPDSDKSILKIRDGSFDWRSFFEQSPPFIECIVLIDSSTASSSYEEEWNALRKILEEYNEEFNKMSFADTCELPGLALNLYFAPSDLYAESAEVMNEPLTLNNEEEVYEYLEEKLGEPCGAGAGCGLTSDMILEWKEPYLEYRKNIGKSYE